ncbi:MAG TPA: 3-beta hydroxysteroid dehydrogenase [Citreicella sp.]|nr:3-beta hydroxysteroid dehydrogenase [Citreicella sp.]
MRIFVTGATGFVGAAVVSDLQAHGHSVLGLARSDRSAAQLKTAGAEVLRGDLAMPDRLVEGARAADAILHAGFLHDFPRFAEACEIDRRAIEALGSAVAGTGKPLVVTAGLAFLDTAGAVAVETDRAFPPSAAYPRATEAVADALCAQGVPVTILRLPPSVHGRGDHGFVPMLIDIARRTGRAAYIGEGANLWPAVAVQDAARLYRLAVEQGPSAEICHAVGEAGVPFRQIAEAIATGLGVPSMSLSEEEARAHFGWFFPFATIDQTASGDRTRARLGWQPGGPDLLTDLRSAGYFEVPVV